VCRRWPTRSCRDRNCIFTTALKYSSTSLSFDLVGQREDLIIRKTIPRCRERTQPTYLDRAATSCLPANVSVKKPFLRFDETTKKKICALLWSHSVRLQRAPRLIRRQSRRRRLLKKGFDERSTVRKKHCALLWSHSVRRQHAQCLETERRAIVVAIVRPWYTNLSRQGSSETLRDPVIPERVEKPTRTKHNGNIRTVTRPVLWSF